MADQTPFGDPYYDRLRLFLDASREETERGRVLVASSLIEEMLEEILRAFLAEDKATNTLFDGGFSPVGSLSAKATLARSLRLISEDEFSDIGLVRRIRNSFAHSVLCSFDDPKIRDWGLKLKVGMGMLDALEEGHASRVDDPMGRFSMVTTSLVSGLYNRAHHVRKIRVADRLWSE